MHLQVRSYERGVAQLGSAGALGALGRRFESCRLTNQNQVILASYPFALSFYLLAHSGQQIAKKTCN